MKRSPRAWLDPRAVRLVAFAAFALLGSLQWVRYVDGASSSRALVWALGATLTGTLITLAGTHRLVRLAAILVGAALAVGASGMDLTLLEPKHWDELGDGVYRGIEALNSVRLPYLGSEPWVLRTLELAGAVICWLAAVFAFGWPDGRGRFAALLLLLVFVAAPVVSLGTNATVTIGLAVALLTAAFVWLERLSSGPGLGLALLVGVAALAAVPLGTAADREEPWFDYKAFSERLTGSDPVSFNWDHEYGPIDWTREGVEMFRVDSELPRYWKVETLNDFDGRLWTSRVQDDLGISPEADLPEGEPRQAWITEFDVSVRALESRQLVGSGTTLDITEETEDVEPALVPGQWQVADGDELGEGDFYHARAYVPTPKPDELAAATVGGDPRRFLSLQIDTELARPLERRLPGAGITLPISRATVGFPAYETGLPPLAEVRELDLRLRGPTVMRRSAYARTWQLAQRLRRGSDSPYAYVLAVDEYLRGSEFRYTEKPPAVPEGIAPLEAFIFDTRRGYCQQFSGAMALLLRMGGVPARIATGFSPGGQRDSGEWVIRDTDAHSWVEAWFDGIGWVTFDPTPPATPARSQIAATVPASADEGGGVSDAAAAGSSVERRRPIPGVGPGGAGAETTASEDGRGVPWPWLAGAAAVLLVLIALARRAARRASTPEGALADLERALRRAGRAASPGTTLAELERSLGAAPGGYLDALRAARFSPGAPNPDLSLRRAFRRDLAAALGPAGRLRALYALPPTLPAHRPSSSVDRATAS